MTNKTALIIVGITVVALGLYIKVSSARTENSTLRVEGASQQSITPQVDSVKSGQTQQNIEPADKIEVANFFGTQRCVSCLTIGKLSKKVVTEKFAPEVASGKIVFLEKNVELPDNKEIVTKYQARGSSFYINAIRNGQDNIEEDTNVWRLVRNEAQFITYLEGKLNMLLGK